MLRIFTFLLLSFSTTILCAQSDVTIKSVQKISNSSGGLGSVISSGGRFGSRIANMGDLDGNGVLDVAVGEENADDGGTDKGAVWILFLKDDGTVKSKQKISQTSGSLGLTLASGTHFGFSLANIGDLDGDGVPELAVGSIVENSNSGAVWILFMKSDGTVKSTSKIDKYTSNFTSLDNNDNFGYDIAGIRDVNGDGIVDIAVGVLLDDDGGTDRGAVYVIFLKSDGSVKGYQKISSTQGNFSATLSNDNFFGVGVSGISDVNSDGVPDIAVGVYDDDGATNAGAVYILKLKNDGTVKNYNKISNNSNNFSNVLPLNSYFGRSIAITNDKNGDGINDLLVTAVYDNGSGIKRGAAFIICLDSSQNVEKYFKYNSQTSALSGYLDDGDCLGSVISLDNFAAGKENVFAAGATYDDDGATDAGAVYIITLKTPHIPDFNYTKFTFYSDTICADSFVISTVYVKNEGKVSATNPTVNFIIQSDTIIKQKFTYSGTIAAGDSVHFDVKLNLYSGGITKITSYTLHSEDTIPGNDTFKNSVVVVNLKPSFTAKNSCISEDIAFSNTSIYAGADTVKYKWDFGDGNISDSLNPTHIYNTAGTFNVKLTLSTNQCSKTFSKDIIIFPLPEVSFTHDTACNEKITHFKETINLNGESMAAMVWDFGDHANSVFPSPSHEYKDTGTYFVSLKIITANGCNSTFIKTVKIIAMPETGYTRKNDTLFAKTKNAITYQWFKNGKAIPDATKNYFTINNDGFYTVLLANEMGCSDSAKSTYEFTRSYLKGIVSQSNNQPLKFSMVVLAKIDMQNNTVEYLDSVWTDEKGAYNFETKEKQVYIFAVPTLNLYPDEIQTYYNASLTIQDADAISLNYGEYNFNFKTIKKQSENGTVTLNGTLKFCNTCQLAGQNASDISLILVDDESNPLLRLQTNQKGEFAFPALSSGTYRLCADKLLINNAIAPEFNIDTVKIHATTATVSLHDTFMTLENLVSIAERNITSGNQLKVYPNPGNGVFKVINSAQGANTFYSIVSLDGKIIWKGKSTDISETKIDISAAAPGIYFLKAQTQNNIQTLKIIKN